jgi:hypothetical protein
MKLFRTRISPLAALWLGSLACSSDPDAQSTLGAGVDAGSGQEPAEVSFLDAGSTGVDGSTPSADEDTGAPTVVQVDAEPETCADIATTPLRTIPSVTFLVDGSGSMDCVYPEDPACDCEGQLFKRCTAQGALSRWQALAQALFGTSSEPGLIPAQSASIRFGLWIYNNARGASECPGYPAQVAPALDQAAALAAAFPDKPPGFNTPTARALSALAAALPDPATVAQQKLGPQKIVLATDGQPFACQDPVKLDTPALDYDAVLDATRGAVARSVDLYVMSLAPASGDFAAHLDAVAREGRSARAYTPANKAELSTALDEIIASAISCTLTLNGSVPRPEQCRGRATLGERELGCGDANGFALRDATHVELLGEACRRFKHEPGVALQVIFPCDGFQLQ